MGIVQTGNQKWPNQPCRGAFGFTLTELLITVALAAILAALAAPSFREFIAGQRVTNASFDLMSMLTLVRSEAIKRNGNATLAGLGSGNLVATAGGVQIQQWEPFEGVTLTCKLAGTVVSCPDVVYAGNGRIQAVIPSVELSSAGSTRLSCISVDLSGRPTSKRGAC